MHESRLVFKDLNAALQQRAVVAAACRVGELAVDLAGG